MPVTITWNDICGWKVTFGEVNKTLWFGDYQQAYFWKKYEADLDVSFVRDYVTNL